MFLELSKAFDTVNDQNLFEKLEKQYGIRGWHFKLFEKYLANRAHFVSMENIPSQKAIITCVVSQGSNLGPLLFLLYVMILHMSQNLKQLYLHMTNFFIFQQNRSPI